MNPRPSLSFPVARHALALLVAGLVVLAPLATAHAERADRNKPINVESDRLEYDDLKQVNVFIGNVTLTKGTLVLRADRLVLRQDPEGYQYGDAYGRPASFRQRRDPTPEAPDQWVEGYGERLEYDGKQEVIRLHQKAALKRLDRERVTDEVYGSLITYDSRSEFVTVDGGGPAAATGTNPKGRVRVIIQPRQQEAPDVAPAPAAPLRPAPALGAPPSGSGR